MVDPFLIFGRGPAPAGELTAGEPHPVVRVRIPPVDGAQPETGPGLVHRQNPELDAQETGPLMPSEEPRDRPPTCPRGAPPPAGPGPSGGAGSAAAIFPADRPPRTAPPPLRAF